MLAACGQGQAMVAERPIPPNTQHACMRAIRCQVFAEHEYQACVNCLEHVDKELLAQISADWGGLPPLDQVDCDTLAYVCREDVTNVAMCIHEEWYGA